MFFACKPALLETADNNVENFITEGINNILSDITDLRGIEQYARIDTEKVLYHLDGVSEMKWESLKDNMSNIIDGLYSGRAIPTKVGVEGDDDEERGLVVFQVKFYMMLLNEESQDKTYKKILRYINHISQKLDECIDNYPFVEDVALLFDKIREESYDMNNEETRIKFIEQSLVLMDNGKPILYPNNKKALYEVLYRKSAEDEDNVETNIEVIEPAVKDTLFTNITFADINNAFNTSLKEQQPLYISDNSRHEIFISDKHPLFEVKYIDEKKHNVYLIPYSYYPYPNVKGCTSFIEKPSDVNIKWICQNKKDFIEEIDKASEEQKFTKLLHLVAERANKREYFNSTTSASIIQAFEENNVAFNRNNKYYPSGLLALIQFNKTNIPQNDWQLPTRKMAENMFGNSNDYYCVEDVFDFGDTQITTPEFKTLVPVLIRQLN